MTGADLFLRSSLSLSPTLRVARGSRPAPFTVLGCVWPPLSVVSDETFDGTGYWSPANGIETILMSIISLFSDPNPNDPANADAAGMYTTNRKQFVERVKETIRTSIAEKPEDLEIEEEVEHVLSQ